MDDKRVWIRGVGMTRFVRRSALGFAGMGQEAVRTAMSNGGVDAASVDEVICGTGYGGPLAGQRIVGPLGFSGCRVVNVENACSSGVTALALGWEAVRSGRAKTVLVIGIDRLSALGRGTLPLESSDIEVVQGLVMPATYAMRAQRYLLETGAQLEDLARVSVKARENGALNEYAQMRVPVTLDEVMESRPVADPLRLLMCCPSGDGAAAVILSSAPPGDGQPGVDLRTVTIRSGIYTDSYRDMTISELSWRTIELAYAAAEVQPSDVSFAETHDAFAIAELMYYEAFRFAARGEGWKMIRSGETALDGRVPVNPSGGLLARGHPVGATGVAQVVEAFLQIAGEAGDRQVKKPTVGVTHATGGGIAGVDHGACGVAVVGAA